MTALDSANEFLDLPPTAGTHPSATPEQQALLDWAAANDIERPRIPLDGNSRYRAAAPDGDGVERGHTRVTTFCEELDGDSTGLNIWRNRLLATGLVATDERVEAVRRAVATDDRKAITNQVGIALHHAGEKLAADLGTAFHTAMENAVHGTGKRPPAPYDADVEATLKALATAGLHPTAATETVLYVPDYDLIGTGDLMVRGDWGDGLRIADYKTGSSCERIGYAVQQACYAHASHYWTADGWKPVPSIDQSAAYLIHTPLGTGTCEIVEIDVAAAWDLAGLAAQLRDVRKAASVRALFTPVAAAGQTESALAATLADAIAGGDADEAMIAAYENAAGSPAPAGQGEAGTTCPASPEDAGVPTAPAAEEVGTLPPPAASASPHAGGPAPMDDSAARSAWIRDRLVTIRDSGNDVAVAAVRRFWPENTPFAGPWDDAAVDAIDAVLAQVERLDDVGFAGHDPADPPALPAAWPTEDEVAAAREEALPTRTVVDDGAPPEPAAVDALRTLAKAPDTAAKGAVIKMWRQQGRTAGRRWDVAPEDLTVRLCAVMAAAIAAAASLVDASDTDDTLVRHAIAEATGLDSLPASWTTGACLGSLTLAEAQRLEHIARLYGDGDTEVTETLVSRLSRQFAQAS